MKHTLYMIILGVAMAACQPDIKVSSTIDKTPDIYPQYQGVTVPVNIAPLNFTIEGTGECGAIIEYKDKRHSLIAHNGDIDTPLKLWRSITAEAAGDSVRVTVCKKSDDGWKAYRPFYIHVSADSIDNTLVYRLIPPLYGTWREIGIYQRDLETFDEQAIYKNTSYHGNCVNCHSFCNRDSRHMLFHLRGPGGGTYLMADDTKYRLDTKTDSTISNFTYPYWHPTGKYVAFSVNDIFQVFHTTDPNRTEVIDDKSDIVVYDIAKGAAVSSHLIKKQDRLETFPAFSPDGKKLYFCTAEKPDTLPEKYASVKYSLCSIDFDAATGTFGEKVDTLFNAHGDSIGNGPQGSVTVPRPSPDGRYLAATFSGYGQFMIWHKDADLWLYDIEQNRWTPMTGANSDDVDSYHSWSSNSRWLVLSSRRDDGLYTRPYIVHVDKDGNTAKAFMLPQRHPKKYYTDQENSYNIPELVNGPVELTTHDVIDWIECPATKVRWQSR